MSYCVIACNGAKTVLSLTMAGRNPGLYIVVLRTFIKLGDNANGLLVCNRKSYQIASIESCVAWAKQRFRKWISIIRVFFFHEHSFTVYLEIVESFKGKAIFHCGQ